MSKVDAEPRRTYTVKVPYLLNPPACIADFAAGMSEAELPATARRVLKAAQENGWVLNGRGLTMVMRLDKPDDEQAVPFYATWQYTFDAAGKGSWRFVNANAANWQPLTFHDVFTVLKDPGRIWPEDNQEGTE